MNNKPVRHFNIFCVFYQSQAYQTIERGPTTNQASDKQI
jgi:hypothetical protein